jgi:peptidoglycan/xylan/chitin deacetylase (PgdA/CDA1 family)
VGRRLSILIFHRVLPAPDPLLPEEPDAAQFDAAMRWVASSFNVLTVGEAIERRREDTLPSRALCITFDDGYADNAEVALPILARHGLRATFFVATGFIGGGRMFNDTVIEALRNTAADELDFGPWGLAVAPLRTGAERRRAISALLPRIKYLALAEREEALARLVRIARPSALPDDLMMQPGQIVELHRAGMEIGGHTVHHPILSLLVDDHARAEIAEGRTQLQRWIDAPVDVFAYPNGRPDRDYDARHVAMVRDLGFRGAVSTAIGVAAQAADPYQLPRFTPWDRDAMRWIWRLQHQRVVGASHARAAPR